MDNQGGVSVFIAAMGFAGTILAGVLGYQSGAAAVDKDYVQIATTILGEKDSSPELRRWSVDVLSTLSPVPFTSELKKELSEEGLGNAVYVVQTVKVPKELAEPCPDLLKGIEREIDTDQSLKVVNEYDKCRLRHSFLMRLITEYNKIAQDFNRDRDRAASSALRK